MQDSKSLLIRTRGFNFAKDINVTSKWHIEHLEKNFPTQVFNKELFENDIKVSPGIKKMILVSNEVVGFLWVNIIYNPYEVQKIGQIKYIHIDPSYQGQGVGLKAMYIAETLLKECKYIELGTHIDNEVANNFYKKLGYKPYRITYRKELWDKK